MSGKSLLFDGTLELCGDGGIASDGSFWFEALTGSSFGDPQPVEAAITSLLRDGALTSTERDDNREVSILVRVKGTDSAALAAGVAALHRAVGRQSTLVWTPPDEFAPPTVFDVQTSSLANPGDFDDLDYTVRNQQTYRLRLVCLPYARSDTLIIDDAGTPPSTGGTLLYNCESTSGWSAADYAGAALSGGVFAVDSVIYTEGAGSMKSLLVGNWDQGFESHYAHGASFDRVTGLALSTGAGGYMSVAIKVQYEDDVGYGASGLFQVSMQVGGVWVTPPSFVAVSRDALGFVRYVWPVDAGLTVTGLFFTVLQSKAAQFVDPPFTWYDDVELLPAATTDHQIVKQLTVQGSARTTGSLRVSAPSESVPLGQVLAITASTSEVPAGSQPDGRRWVTNGTTTADATALHGSYFTPNSSYAAGSTYPVFDVPVGMLTAGPYTVVALVKAEASSLTFGVQAQLRVGSTDLGPTSSAEVSPTGLTTGWQFITVGTVYLPPLPVQNADTTTKVRLLFQGAKMADIFMIPAWQVGGRPVADFSIVDCGTGTVSAAGASSSLWIDTPSTSQPQGGWWRGPTTDRANAISAWPDAKKPGVHALNPGGLSAFLISTGAAGPTLALEYFDRYFGLVAWPETEAS